MKKPIILIFGISILSIFQFCNTSGLKNDNILLSPDSTLKVLVKLIDNSLPVYQITKNNTIVIEESKLGIKRKDGDFTEELKLINTSVTEPVNDNYILKVGKRLKNIYSANKKTFHFENMAGQKMDIIFQLSNDGVAFRYYFPEKSEEIKYIEAESSTFNFPEGTKAWMQPCSNAKSGWSKCNPSYEENYLMNIPVGTASPIKAGWVFPALFKSGENWVVISETGLANNYCASRLQQESPNGEYIIGFPQEAEVMEKGEHTPQSILPWYSPWRILVIGSLKTVAESTLGTDLAAPAIEGDFSWVKPGRASWSWVLLKDDKTIYPVQKEFIDYASEMGWEYCLIDAYWDTQIGYEKIKELADYAKTKGVELLLWYNSAGDWNKTPLTPKNLMLTSESRKNEFNKIKKMGIAGVKIDFFGGDGQSVIQYYHEILKDAAEVGIHANFHGCTLPRGWQRTYPNLMTMEAIKGMEFITFEQANADKALTHCAVLPFTRNIFDPMDFTPVCFSEVPNINRHSTNGFELALSVLFISGIQHFAETAEGMSKVPVEVKDAMKNVPVAWDESIFIDGFPGKYIVMARRSGSKWFVAGINSEQNQKQLSLKLPFLKSIEGQLITDGENNRSFTTSDILIPESGEYKITIKAHGGFLMQFN